MIYLFNYPNLKIYLRSNNFNTESISVKHYRSPGNVAIICILSLHFRLNYLDEKIWKNYIIRNIYFITMKIIYKIFTYIIMKIISLDIRIWCFSQVVISFLSYFYLQFTLHLSWSKLGLHNCCNNLTFVIIRECIVMSLYL